MPVDNEFPESNSMLDDLLATDALPDEPVHIAALQFESVEGFVPVDMRMLAAGDFAIVIGCLMRRLGLESVTIPDSERSGLDPTDPSLCTVLVCEADNTSQDIRFTIHQSTKSEFRP